MFNYELKFVKNLWRKWQKIRQYFQSYNTNTILVIVFHRDDMSTADSLNQKCNKKQFLCDSTQTCDLVSGWHACQIGHVSTVWRDRINLYYGVYFEPYGRRRIRTEIESVASWFNSIKQGVQFAGPYPQIVDSECSLRMRTVHLKDITRNADHHPPMYQVGKDIGIRNRGVPVRININSIIQGSLLKPWYNSNSRFIVQYSIYYFFAKCVLY